MFRIVIGLVAIFVFLTACGNEIPTAPSSAENRDSIGGTIDKSRNVSSEEQITSELASDSLDYDLTTDDIRRIMTWKSARYFDDLCKQFIQNNSGSIPLHLGDADDSGKLLFQYFPNSTLMKNEFYGYRTEPQMHTMAAAPGQIGYQLIERSEIVVGYVITAFGASADEQLTIVFDPENERKLPRQPDTSKVEFLGR